MFNVGDVVYYTESNRKRYCKIRKISGGVCYGYWTDSENRVEIVNKNDINLEFEERWSSMNCLLKRGCILKLYRDPKFEKQMLDEIDKEYE